MLLKYLYEAENVFHTRYPRFIDIGKVLGIQHCFSPERQCQTGKLIKTTVISQCDKCFTDNWFLLYTSQGHGLVRQIDIECAVIVRLVFFSLGICWVSSTLWFTLLKVVQHIAGGSSLLEKLMFYSIKFHFASAKKRLSQSNMLPFVISMYSVQTCRPRCFMTQLGHTAGNELHVGSDIWNHSPPPNQEIATAAVFHFENKGYSCYSAAFSFLPNKSE